MPAISGTSSTSALPASSSSVPSLSKLEPTQPPPAPSSASSPSLLSASSSRKRARLSNDMTSTSAPAASSSPWDHEIDTALASLDGSQTVQAEDGMDVSDWSEREKELLKRLKGKGREVIELVSTIASSPSLSHLPSFFPPPPPSSLPSSIPKPKAPPASSIPSAATAPQVLVDHLRTLQHENTLLRSLLSNESGKIDLAKVVQRMKLLMRENEELEERVMRVQEGDGEVKMEGMETDAEEGLREGEGEEELRRAVDDCHQTILALDADLSIAYSRITTLKANLETYLVTCGPLPDDPSSSSSLSASQRTTTSSPRNHLHSPSHQTAVNNPSSPNHHRNASSPSGTQTSRPVPAPPRGPSNQNGSSRNNGYNNSGKGKTYLSIHSGGGGGSHPTGGRGGGQPNHGHASSQRGGSGGRGGERNGSRDENAGGRAEMGAGRRRTSSSAADLARRMGMDLEEK